MNTDDLDDLLSPSSPPTRADRREAVWQRTSRVLRRQKVRRDVVRMGGYLLLLGAGLGAGWYLRPTPAPPDRVVAQQPGASTTPAVDLARTAQQLELDAERAEEVTLSAQLYRTAGDRYLKQGNDIASAVRCYRQHLDLLGARGRVTVESDSWLLLSLKRAQSQGEVQ